MSKKFDGLPHWPAALNKGMAAAYCGVSYDLFSKVCPVKPIEFTDSVKGQRYLRQRLDEWLLSLDTNEPTPVQPRKSKFAERIETPEIENGVGGFPIISDPSHPVKKYYDQLGFDPWTMNENDLKRLTAANRAAWEASIPGSRLGKREIKALNFLASMGPNTRVHWRDLKDCGPDTEERLKIRGYLKTEPQENYPDRIGNYMLTDEGFAASQESRT